MHQPTQSTATPVDKAIKAAVIKLLQLQTARVPVTPGPQDAIALQTDLETLAHIFDAVIEAVGEYAAENFCGIDRGLFNDQLSTAIDGMASYSLERAAQNLQEEYDELPRRRELQRERV